eukprot:2238548-Rhodomonas_salina.1
MQVIAAGSVPLHALRKAGMLDPPTREIGDARYWRSVWCPQLTRAPSTHVAYGGTSLRMVLPGKHKLTLKLSSPERTGVKDEGLLCAYGLLCDVWHRHSVWGSRRQRGRGGGGGGEEGEGGEGRGARGERGERGRQRRGRGDRGADGGVCEGREGRRSASLRAPRHRVVPQRGEEGGKRGRTQNCRDPSGIGLRAPFEISGTNLASVRVAAYAHPTLFPVLTQRSTRLPGSKRSRGPWVERRCGGGGARSRARASWPRSLSQ